MSRGFSAAPATSLRQAFENDKQTGLKRHRRGMERLAEFMGGMKTSLLYDWVDECRMPAHSLAAWCGATGGTAVLRYLAAQAGHVLVEIPAGRDLKASDVQGLQRIVHDAIGALLGFSEGKSSADDTLAALLHAMGALAWHRENVKKHNQPELDLGDPE